MGARSCPGMARLQGSCKSGGPMSSRPTSGYACPCISPDTLSPLPPLSHPLTHLPRDFHPTLLHPQPPLMLFSSFHSSDAQEVAASAPLSPCPFPRVHPPDTMSIDRPLLLASIDIAHSVKVQAVLYVPLTCSAGTVLCIVGNHNIQISPYHIVVSR